MNQRNSIEYDSLNIGDCNNIRDSDDPRFRHSNDDHKKLLEVLLPDLNEEDIILDTNCGTGQLASLLLDYNITFRELVLNDPSPRMLGIARERLPDDRRILFTAYPPHDLLFDNNRFTKIICLNAFHHYDHPSSAVRNFKNVMTPNGTLYLLDWNWSGWYRLFLSLFNRNNSDITHNMNQSEVIQLLLEHDFNIQRTGKRHFWNGHLFFIVAGFQPWRTY